MNTPTRRRFVAGLAWLSGAALLPRPAASEAPSCSWTKQFGPWEARANLIPAGRNAEPKTVKFMEVIGNGRSSANFTPAPGHSVDLDRPLSFGWSSSERRASPWTLTLQLPIDRKETSAMDSAIGEALAQIRRQAKTLDLVLKIDDTIVARAESLSNLNEYNFHFSDAEARNFLDHAVRGRMLEAFLVAASPQLRSLLIDRTNDTLAKVRYDLGGFSQAVASARENLDRLERDAAARLCEPRGCFVTTACCDLLGLADDCWELTTLRHFRDHALSALPGGLEDVAQYYREAPAALERLRRQADAERLLLDVYWRYVLPSAVLAAAGCHRAARSHYRRMMRHLATQPKTELRPQ